MIGQKISSHDIQFWNFISNVIMTIKNPVFIYAYDRRAEKVLLGPDIPPMISNTRGRCVVKAISSFLTAVFATDKLYHSSESRIVCIEYEMHSPCHYERVPIVVFVHPGLDVGVYARWRPLPSTRGADWHRP